jgi:chemotaxis protein methyltransferase CheR
MTASAEVTRFRELLATALGWTFDDNECSHLDDVLGNRSGQHGLSQAAYLSRLAASAWEAELTALVQELSINETYFYRHSEQFRALAEVALPERIRARSAQRMVRMLSVGCSSGEEAFTLAIVAREVLPNRSWVTSVLGLDADPAVLRRAALARFSAWSLRETPDAIRQRWFRHRDGEFDLDVAIRSVVQFRQYNVATDDQLLWQPDQYDIVFCRNLLMYLTPATRSSLVQRMTRSLAPGGYLFLGHTDSLGSRPDGLEPQHTHHTFYYRRRQQVTMPPITPAAPTSTVLPVSTAPPGSPAPTVGKVPLVSADPPVSAAASGSKALAGSKAPLVNTAPVAGTAPRGPRPVSPRPESSDVHDSAMRLLLDERFAEALPLIEDEAATRPTPRVQLLRAVLLAHSGRLDDAEMVCRLLLEVDGLDADAHHQLAVCLEGGAAVDVAIGHYRLAAYLDPDFAMPRLRLGLLARRRGENRIAGPELDRALALLRQEGDERIALFGGGFGRNALATLCRAELNACGAYR